MGCDVFDPLIECHARASLLVARQRSLRRRPFAAAICTGETYTSHRDTIAMQLQGHSAPLRTHWHTRPHARTQTVTRDPPTSLPPSHLHTRTPVQRRELSLDSSRRCVGGGVCLCASGSASKVLPSCIASHDDSQLSANLRQHTPASHDLSRSFSLPTL